MHVVLQSYLFQNKLFISHVKRIHDTITFLPWA